jgi:VanZ family protein
VILVSGLLPTQGAVHAISGGRDELLTTTGHLAAYAMLGFLLGVALGGWRVRVRALLAGLALAAALGGLVEVLQAPLPYRDAQLSDFIVDVAGAVAGLAAFSVAALAARSPSHRG